MDNLSRDKIKCAVCNKTAAEIPEYVELAEVEGYDSAAEAVVGEEGTYNPTTGRFYCTSDYIKIGMPSGVAP